MSEVPFELGVVRYRRCKGALRHTVTIMEVILGGSGSRPGSVKRASFVGLSRNIGRN